MYTLLSVKSFVFIESFYLMENTAVKANAKKFSIKRVILLFVPSLIFALPITPFLGGVVESYTNIGFLGDGGRCRLDNTMQVLLTKDKSTRIINGFVKFDGKEFGHTWGVTSSGKTIDVTCDDRYIDYRRPVETINPWNATMPVVKDESISIRDKVTSTWNRIYFGGFIGYKRIAGEI